MSGGATPPSGAKKSPMICSKLAKTFLLVTMTPAGVRVDPDVYCKYMKSARSLAAARDLGPVDRWRESRSSQSTSTIDGADFACCDWTDAVTLSMTADVVRTTAGEVSASTEIVRSSWAPP